MRKELTFWTVCGDVLTSGLRISARYFDKPYIGDPGNETIGRRLTRTNDGTIHTQVYRKQTHIDQILNYNSNHPTQHKISCIKTLFNRINTHCNTEHAKVEERKYLYSTFAKNNYPRAFTNKILTKTQHKHKHKTTALNNIKKPKLQYHYHT